MDAKRICQVCGDQARPKEIFFCHYGAICCLSCKAFFRRIFRELKRPEKVKCKVEGQCEILKKCRKCRFDKCIRMGMKPDMVPNEEESKQYTYSNKKSLRKISLTLLKAVTRPNGYEGLASSIDLMVDFLTTSFHEASNEVRENAEVISQILVGHLSSIWTHEHTQHIFVAHDYLSKLFAKFAGKIYLFASLSQADQSLLLTNNSGLYLSYIMARYVNAGNGFDQVSWLFGPNLPSLPLAQIMMLQRISLPSANLDHPTNAFEANISKLVGLCQLIGHNFDIPQYLNGLSAHFILFTTSRWSTTNKAKLQEASKIDGIFKLSEHLLRSKLPHLERHNQNFIPLLMQIESLFSSLANNYLQIHNMNSQKLTLPEMEWIQEKSGLFHLADSLVPVSQDFFDAYHEFSEHQGAPMLFAKVCLTGSAIFYKRCKEMLQLLDAKKPMDQVNFAQVIAISSLKITSISSAQDQIAFFAGHSAAALWTNQKLSTVGDIHSVQHLELKHDSEVQEHLSTRLQDFIRNDTLYILTIFLLLLDNPEWQELQECTRKLLLKQLTHITHVNPEVVLNNFYMDLKEYSKINGRWIEMIGQSCS